MIDIKNAYKKFENLMEQVDRSCNISLDEEESLYRQIEDDIKWKLQQVHADKNTWQVITNYLPPVSSLRHASLKVELFHLGQIGAQ